MGHFFASLARTSPVPVALLGAWELDAIVRLTIGTALFLSQDLRQIATLGSLLSCLIEVMTPLLAAAQSLSDSICLLY